MIRSKKNGIWLNVLKTINIHQQKFYHTGDDEFNLLDHYNG